MLFLLSAASLPLRHAPFSLVRREIMFMVKSIASFWQSWRVAMRCAWLSLRIEILFSIGGEV